MRRSSMTTWFRQPRRLLVIRIDKKPLLLAICALVCAVITTTDWLSIAFAVVAGVCIGLAVTLPEGGEV